MRVFVSAGRYAGQEKLSPLLPLTPSQFFRNCLNFKKAPLLCSGYYFGDFGSAAAVERPFFGAATAPPPFVASKPKDFTT